MCGRSSLTKKEKELEQRFNATFYSDELERYNPLPNFNVCPTHMHPVILNTDPSHIAIYRWGLIPSWAKDEKIAYNMINCRIETVGEKTSFKNLVSKKRCLIPMDGFYEWRTSGKEKQPYRIFVKSQEIFSLAGLYESWKSPEGHIINTYTIITLEANEFMSKIHNRMPAILPLEKEELWLKENITTDNIVDFLTPFESDNMDSYPVDKKVGNVRERGPELIQPVSIQTSLF